MRLSFVIFILFFFIPTIVFADAKSDFEYQYTKYRDNYLEFSIFKKDYLATPSLDNQQKVLLSLKQSLVARDLSKASLSRYLSDLILTNQVNYDPLVPVLQALESARQYFTLKANEAQTVVTLENLKEFDKEYLATSLNSERALKLGIVSHKIAKLVRIQNDSQKAYETLKYRLPDTISIRAKERLSELERDHLEINKKIDELANLVVSIEGQENVDSPVFFSGKVEPLMQIRTMQLNWIDKLIDLDRNYAKI